MAGFRFVRDLHGEEHAPLVPFIITNSQTLTKGQAVKLTSGFLITAVAGGKVLGIVEGFSNSSGIPLNQPFQTFTGTYTSGDIATETYAASSSNQTVDKVVALVRISMTAQYSVAPNATIGTTTGSNLAGYFTDCTVGGLTTTETSASAGAGSFYIWGVDPQTTANQLVSIAEPHSSAAAQA